MEKWVDAALLRIGAVTPKSTAPFAAACLTGRVATRPWFTAYGVLVVIASIAAVRGGLLTLSCPLRCRQPPGSAEWLRR